MEKRKRKGMLELITANGAGEAVQEGLDESREIAERVEARRLKIETDTIRTPLGRDNTVTIPSKGRPNTGIVPPSGQEQDRNRTPRPDMPLISLSERQDIIYNWFLQHGFKGTFNKEMIRRETGIPYETIRKSIRKFENSLLIRLHYDTVAKLFDYELNSDIQPKRNSNRTVSGQEHNSNRTVSYIEEEETLLLLEKFILIYPSIHGIGFEKSQIQDVIQSWKLNNIDLKDLPESLQRADYAVEHKSFKMNDPLNYVYSALMKGIFRKPQGYKSRAEIQAEERLAEQKQISEKNDEAFQLWCDNLSPEKRAELCKEIPRIKQSVHLRGVFDKSTA